MGVSEAWKRIRHRPSAPARVELAGARVLEGVAIGSGVDRDAIEGLARAGFRAIVAVGAEGEAGERLSPSVEASWAHTFGMQHGRLYVDGSPRGEAVDALSALLARFPRPLYLHSLTGERAAAVALVLYALDRKLDGERALEEAARAGLALSSEDLKRFVVEELRLRAPSFADRASIDA